MLKSLSIHFGLLEKLFAFKFEKYEYNIRAYKCGNERKRRRIGQTVRNLLWHLLPHGTRNYGSCSMPQLTSCYCLARMQLGFIFLVLSKLISISLYFFNCSSIQRYFHKLPDVGMFFQDCSKITYKRVTLWMKVIIFQMQHILRVISHAEKCKRKQ